MMMLASITFLVVAILVGVVLAIYMGIHSSLNEFAMLLGLGGWPGYLATGHLILWVAAIYVAGPPPSDWILYSTITIVLIGSVAAPFYVNNHPLLRTIRSHASAISPTTADVTDGDLIPISGTVVLEEEAIDGDSPIPLEPVVAPFTATSCAAYEWAVKRRQWSARRTAYMTVDSGEQAGAFLVDTGDGYVGVRPSDPTLLLISGIGVTGYDTTTRKPSTTIEDGASLTGSVFNNMRYCETTIEGGDTITVVGPAATAAGSHLLLSDPAGAPMFIINDDFERIKSFTERYLRWTPHVAAVTLVLGWIYVGVVMFGM